MTLWTVLVVLSTAAASAAWAFGAQPTQPPVERIDVPVTGSPAESYGGQPDTSADGRFVVYVSDAGGLVAAESDDLPDVFVRDRALLTTSRVSVAMDGSEGNDYSSQPSISADGRYVAFQSAASDLVRRDTNRAGDVFVHDLLRHETTRISVRSDGRQANQGGGDEAAISANGRFIAFASSSTNLVPGRTQGTVGIYVHDRTTGRTTAVGGADAVGYGSLSISADGRFVTYVRSLFSERSANISEQWAIFVRDRKARRTMRVDVNSRQRKANGDSYSAAISASGRDVAFVSEATNLVPGDENRGADVFVRDLRRRRTVQASIRPDGTPVPKCPRARDDKGQLYFLECGREPAMSATGRFVAFTTRSPVFDPDDQLVDSAGAGVFVRDMRVGTTAPVMTGRSDHPDGWGRWTEPAISADGRFVVASDVGLYMRGPLR